jgi:hypothetical protein
MSQFNPQSIPGFIRSGGRKLAVYEYYTSHQTSLNPQLLTYNLEIFVVFQALFHESLLKFPTKHLLRTRCTNWARTLNTL